MLAIWGIRATLKAKKEPEIMYLEEICIPLFDSIVKNMEGMEIFFEKKTIEPSLMFLKGSFYNSGSIDIDSKDIHQPLTIILPEKLKWKRVRVLETASGMNVASRIKGASEVEFNWDLLKKNEFIKFDALIDASGYKPPKEGTGLRSLSKDIRFSQRIANLDKISTIQNVRPKIESILINSVYPLILVAMLVVSFRLLVVEKVTHYTAEMPDKRLIAVDLLTTKDGMFELKGIDNDFSAKGSSEILSQYKLSNPVQVRKKLAPYEVVGASVCTLLFVLGFGYWFASIREKQKIYKRSNINRLPPISGK